eukprot:GHVQ01008283.1.p1 GENE.GHVQ01008283.1~~GHVQ01008283.1.p1  ORF type:complete len:250 (-),score=32.40 GHVQ01008283.1:3419-4168(-)
MAELYESLKRVPPLPTSCNPEPYVAPPPRDYWDKKNYTSFGEWQAKLEESTTVYVGNLSFYSTEAQIWELFSKVGYVKSVVIGLNAYSKSPCGFCFVVYSWKPGARLASQLLNGAVCDGRVVRVDLDPGGQGLDVHRRFGRGEHGLQWRDEFRKDFDVGRGGAGGGIDYESFQAAAVGVGDKRKRGYSFDDRAAMGPMGAYGPWVMQHQGGPQGGWRPSYGGVLGVQPPLRNLNPRDFGQQNVPPPPPR